MTKFDMKSVKTSATALCLYTFICIPCLLVSMLSCKQKPKDSEVDLATTPKPETVPVHVNPGATKLSETKPPETNVETKASGEIWIPQEHTEGLKMFRDPGVYLDGKPIGMLKWGELPVKLKPTWHKEEAAIPFKGNQPRTKIVRQRRYRFIDYFKALGIDVKAIKEVHMYGGAKRSIALVIKGDAFRANPSFAFRFGSDVFGKPIPACPSKYFSDAGCPDNINAIAVYIDKKPPERRGGYFYLNDKKVEGIPYYGIPLRGGVRVYLDGPFVAHIKRHKLESVQDLEGVSRLIDGQRVFSLFAFLKTQGVDTKKVSQAWLIHHDRFVREVSRAELKKATFVAAQRKSGEILFGDEKIACNAISLQSKKISAKNIPHPLAHEIYN